jgi:hypothetical protein
MSQAIFKMNIIELRKKNGVKTVIANLGPLAHHTPSTQANINLLSYRFCGLTGKIPCRQA